MRAIVCFSLLWLAACNSATKLGRETPPEGLQSIVSLKALCAADYYPVAQDISIRGLVVGNDLYGEFPKTLVIQDATGGIAVAVDAANLCDAFPFGSEVTVACNGLTLARYGGKIVLGDDPDGQYGVTRIAGSEVGRYVRLSGAGGISQVSPITFAEIEPEHIDTFVRFDGVRFTQPGTWCEVDAELQPLTTEHTITDAGGETFTVRVSAACSYAKEPVPQGTGSLMGVIDYFAGKYSLRISDHSITAEARPRAYP